MSGAADERAGPEWAARAAADEELRADARRNREQILRAAHLAFLEQGPDAPLDQIATSAGVGNATLYRHFPTRADLIAAVAVDNMEQVAALATEVLAEPSADQALAVFARGSSNAASWPCCPSWAARSSGPPGSARPATGC
ncbi:TetR/AcrR family transcriptional regulator [Nonomuraea antimicrobica]